MTEFEEKQSTTQSILVRILNTAWWSFMVAVIMISLHLARRVFIAERFIVPTSSMQPTLVPGDKVWVNKMIFGGRIYTSFNFDDYAPLKCFRMPGLRKIKPGDVICFNYPLGYDKWTEISFKINYVYCKRVVGTPGDTIGIKDGITWNNNYEGTIGALDKQKIIQDTPDDILWQTTMMTTMPFTRPMWTIKNFGPLYIPEKGKTIELSSINRALYGPVIQYETGAWPTDEITSYTFINDYYFAFGDNSMDSNDSRYWGFIPEDFIIGIVGGKKVRNNPFQTY